MKYMQLANKLQALIDSQVYPVGSSLPGVRRLGTQHGVSISTVVSACSELERRGILEARPRSGFYVKPPLVVRKPPRTRNVNTRPRAVTNQHRLLTMARAVSDPNIVNFGTAIPDPEYLPIADMEKAFHRVVREQRRRCSLYEFPPGAPELRLQIARRLAELNCDVGPENVLITNSCQDSLRIALRLLTKPGDTIAIESPTYYGLLQIIESLQLKAIEIPTDAETGISLQALQLAIEKWPVAACVVVTNISNPLGVTLSDERKQALFRLLSKHRVPLVEDDIYGELPFSGARPKPVLSWDTKGLVYYCGSTSKSLSAGLRVGWLIAGRQQDRAESMLFTDTGAVATPSQLALSQYLAGHRYDRFLGTVQTSYAQCIAQMTDRITQLFPADTRVSRPQGGFLLWVELPTEINTTMLMDKALAEGVSFAPGELFSVSGKYTNCLRLNCAVHWDARVDRGLITLARLIATD